MYGICQGVQLRDTPLTKGQDWSADSRAGIIDQLGTYSSCTPVGPAVSAIFPKDDWPLLTRTNDEVEDSAFYGMPSERVINGRGLARCAERCP